MDGKKTVFVIMPFKDEFFEMYEMLKSHFESEYEFSNVADEGNQQNILSDIIGPIYHADVIIADLTGLNPNVMYELGVAHALNKKVIIITTDPLSDLPFDLKQYRAKDYSVHYKRFAELISYLDRNLRGAITGDVAYSNPVIDFIKLSGTVVEEKQLNFSDDVPQLLDDSDKGFLDFLSDIDNNTDLLAQDFNQMKNDMTKMGNEIKKGNSEIDRVKTKGGNGTASFVKKEVKKIARCMDEFTVQLRNHNEITDGLWNKIEKDALGLIENKYIAMPGNKESLKEYLVSLKSMQCQIPKINESIEKLQNVLVSSIGIERSMTQAIRFLNEDLTTYTDNTERIYDSIKKILKRGELIVGRVTLEDEIGNTNDENYGS